MTENMAARGEGLAGREPDTINLLKYLDSLASRLKSLGIKDDPWYVAGNAISILQELCPPKSALEAAAPANPAHGLFPLTKEQIERITARVQPQIEHEFIHGYTSATAQVLRVLTSLKIELDALATPSPQAPALTCIVPPCSMPASCPEFGYCLAEKSGVPAATQEQPAGSGASEPPFRKVVEWLHQRMAAAQNLPYEEGDVCLECADAVRDELQLLMEAALKLAGSPRKVGEDGALKVGDKVFVRGEVDYVDESSDGVWVGVKVSGHITTMEFAPSELMSTDTRSYENGQDRR